jgi:hypothetical protein
VYSQTSDTLAESAQFNNQKKKAKFEGLFTAWGKLWVGV